MLGITGCGGDTLVPPAALAPPLPLDQLAASLRGTLLRPNSPGYLNAALPWNLRFANVLPLAIAQCQSAEDVRASLLWAQENQVPLVARSGGHSYAGYSTTTGLMIDLSTMNRVDFDPVSGMARVQGGGRNQNVEDALRPASVALPHGRCPRVGVAGLVLGGGIGFDMRLHGLTCDKLLETEVVLASGEIVRANAVENPDLFWACRGGGGGNFGVNTSFIFQTYPVDRVTAYQIIWTERLETLLPLALELFPQMPRELGAKLTAATDGTTLSLELLGQLVGSPADLRALFEPFYQVAAPFSEQIQDMAYWDGQDFLAEPDTTDYSHERSRYAFRPISAEGAAVILDYLRRWPGTGAAANWKFFLAGEQVAALAPDATAFVHRQASLISSIELDWLGTTSPEVVALNQAWQDEFHQAMLSFTSGFCYQNFIDESQQDYLRAYYGSNLERLVEVKRPHQRVSLPPIHPHRAVKEQRSWFESSWALARAPSF